MAELSPAGTSLFGPHGLAKDPAQGLQDMESLHTEHRDVFHNLLLCFSYFQHVLPLRKGFCYGIAIVAG